MKIKNLMLLIILLIPFDGISQNLYEFTKSQNGKQFKGLVNEKGQMVLEPKYESIKRKFISGKGVLIGIKRSSYEVFNPEGLLLESEVDSIYINDCTNQLLMIRKNNKWGFLDNAGSLIFKPQFDSAGIFKTDTSIAYIKKKAFLITSSGNKIIAKKFDIDISDYFKKCEEVSFDIDLGFAGNSYIKQVQGKYGVNKSGNWLIKPKFDKIYDGLSCYLVKNKGLYAIFDETGKQVSEFKFENLKLFQ
ncbi:WG repeat-containing protein [Ekhidna sp.]